MPAIIVNNKGSDLSNDYVLKGLSGGKAITIIVKTKFTLLIKGCMPII